jgi:hypothetical protein
MLSLLAFCSVRQSPSSSPGFSGSSQVWYAKIEDLRVADRMATIMLPFSFIVPLLPIVYGIVRMGYDGAGMEVGVCMHTV